MKKISSSTWLKIALVVSLTLNVMFFAGWIALSSTSDVLRLNVFQQQYCVDNYEEMLQQVAEGQDGEHAEQAKMVYAMTVCLKNYKTGESLDLEPLVKQVEETPLPTRE